jgi:hypothetical protein
MEIPKAEVLSLAAAAQAIFISATLTSRELERIQDCHALWSELSQLFEDLCNSWTGIDAREESIIWLRARLRHFRDLAQDRKEMFSVTEKDRRRHGRTRDAQIESFTERNEITPDGYSSQSTPAHVYSVGHF